MDPLPRSYLLDPKGADFPKNRSHHFHQNRTGAIVIGQVAAMRRKMKERELLK